MNFVSDTIAGYPFWGFFENNSIATAVIRDLKNALEGENTFGSQNSGRYVLAFRIGDRLYVVHRGFYAFLATSDGIWRPRKKLDSVTFPADGVLVLGKEYIDDIPAYTDAKKFCEVIDDNYLQQYCVGFSETPRVSHEGETELLQVSTQQARLLAGKENIFNTIVYSDFHKVSPFELKNTLIKKAQATAKANLHKTFLNVGRGNPNFVNTTAREAFSHMLLFSSSEAKKLAQACEHGDCTDDPAIGFAPNAPGIGAKLDQFMVKLEKDEGGKFLKEAVEWMRNNKIAPTDDNLIHQLTIATLGSFYPDPPAVQPFVKNIMNKYMDFILLHGKRPKEPNKGAFDIFMTEGATAGIIYTFQSLRVNGLLNPGDHIAIITPIFTPYLELPELKNFDLHEIYITGDEEKGWQIPIAHLDKLKDPKIKALFLVNPTNPSAVSMTDAHVRRVGEIVKHDNPDLIIIADSVYAPFVDSYHSFMSHAPRNTVEMYSFSKYFGVTGWRMGMIVMHPNNIIDKKLLPNLSQHIKKQLNKRYSIVTETGQEQLTFMQRLVLDSRLVAEAHTGGLATPQQALMCLFAIYDMTHKEYKPSIRVILVERIKRLYAAIGEEPQLGPKDSDYYTLIDIKKLAIQRHGQEFIPKLLKRDPLEIVFRLAIDYATICLPASGFHGPSFSVRVSLANAPTDNYTRVGENIVAVIDDMYKAYD